MEDISVYFRCEICSLHFEAFPECMLTVEYASYLLNQKKSDKVGENTDLSWEGNHRFNKGAVNFIQRIACPTELSNTAICICKSCQNKLLPTKSQLEQL